MEAGAVQSREGKSERGLTKAHKYPKARCQGDGAESFQWCPLTEQGAMVIN